MSASFWVPTRTRAPLPPSASIRRSELARPISTGITAPGNSTRLRRDRSGRVFVVSLMGLVDLCFRMPRGGKRCSRFVSENREPGALGQGKNARSKPTNLVSGGPAGQLLEQLSRLRVVRFQLGRHDLDAAELIAAGAVAVLDAAAAQPQSGAARGSGRNRNSDAPFERGDLDLRPQRRLGEGHRQGELDVSAVALQVGVLADLDVEVEIARRAAAPG